MKDSSPDAIDSRILGLLRQNSRMSGSDISKHVHMSIPAVSERLRKLEENGIINRYTLQCDREKLNLPLTAYLLVSIDRPENIEPFRSLMKGQECVLECHHIAGEYDYLLKVVVKSTKALEDFITNKMKKSAGVAKSNTIIVLSTVKEEVL